jgi:Prophage tail length tape measure protein
MTDVASLSVSATETGVAKVDSALLGLAKSAGVAEAATGRFSAASKKAASENYAAWQSAGSTLPAFSMAIGKSSPIVRSAGVEMKNYGMHTANVFSQLNDIGMMMAAGQNPLQLALQQGTQLNQVWGQMGGKVSTVGALLRGAFMQLLNPLNLVTIGVIAGGAALMNYFTGGSEAAKTLKDRISDLEASVTSINEITKIYSSDGLQDLLTKYGEVDAALLQMIERQNKFAQNQAMQTARDAIADITAEYGGMLTMIEAGGRAGQTAFFQLKNELGISTQQAIQLRDAIKDANSATTFERQAEALGRMNAILGQSKANVTDVYGAALEAEDAIRQLSNSAPKANWMNASIDGVNALIGRIGAAITAANKLNSFAGTVKGAATGGAGVGAAGSGSFTLESTGKLGGYGSSSGGGGGGSDPYQANLDRLMSSLMTERETVEKWYADNEVILNDRRAMELLGAAGHKEAMLDLERQYHEKLKGIRETSDQFSLDSAASLFGNLNSMAGGGYDGLLRAQRSFAAASALISTYKGAADELARPTATPWQKFASVAKVIATGMGFVSAIKGGGSGGGGGSSKAPTSVGGSAAEPTRTTTVSFQGDPFMVAIAESVMSQMYEASGNGRVLIKA